MSQDGYWIRGLKSDCYHTNRECYYLNRAMTVMEISPDAITDGMHKCRRCAKHYDQHEQDWSYYESLKEAADQ